MHSFIHVTLIDMEYFANEILILYPLAKMMRLLTRNACGSGVITTAASYELLTPLLVNHSFFLFNFMNEEPARQDMKQIGRRK